MEALFGKTLLSKSGEVETATALDGKKAVAVYFSAHWCPPCRAFTPQLAEWYEKDLQGKGLEVVFVSSDRDDGSFHEYFGEQPWLALPYIDREKKEALSKKFKVQGIPTLVILNAEGQLITADGRSAVSRDPTGEDLPWKPKALKDILAGAKVKRNDGTALSIEEAVVGKKALGLYFSAHWCPPCRGFTPKLAEWYTKDLKRNGLEVIFVSSDRDEHSYKEYFGEQPWLAFDFSERKLKDELDSACKVDGIPSFVILEPTDFTIVNKDGRAAVDADSVGNELPWYPKPVQNLCQGPGSINSIPTVLIFCESSSKADQARVEAAMAPVAKKYIADAKAAGSDEPDVSFLIATSSEDLAGRIRHMMGLPTPPPSMHEQLDLPTQMVLVDIPSDGAFYKASAGLDITTEAIEKFIAEWKAGSLNREQLG